MIDLTAIASSAFSAKVRALDTNRDGFLDANEISAASQDALNAIRDAAHVTADWNVVKEIAIIKGHYMGISDPNMKGMEPGAGGRFSHMVDYLMTSRGYSEEAARSIAVMIGKAKYSWMRG